MLNKKTEVLAKQPTTVQTGKIVINTVSQSKQSTKNVKPVIEETKEERPLKHDDDDF